MVYVIHYNKHNGIALNLKPAIFLPAHLKAHTFSTCKTQFIYKALIS